MCSKRKKPLTENETRLPEETREKLKVDETISTQAAEEDRSKRKKPSSSREEKNERRLVWKGRLSNSDIYYGTLTIPFGSAGVLYDCAAERPGGKKNTRLATVQDDEGREWKMKVELRRNNRLFLNCDKFVKKLGLAANDVIFLSCDSSSRFYIDCTTSGKEEEGG